MSYTKTNWHDGDTITAVKMNKIENGIKGIEGDVTTVKDGLSDMDDRVTALEQGGSGSGLTEDIKQALLQIAEKVAYIDEDGQDYYDALEEALYPPADLVSISAVYTQSGTVYTTDTLDSLKSDLVVTAHYSDQTTETITTYTLSGTLTEGTSTVTVAYGGKTTTFTVTVTEYQPITQTITFSGDGSDKTSSVIDATQYDVFYTLPFVESDSTLVSGATAESNGIKQRTQLYTDAECTNLAGYWYINESEISQTSKTTANRPWLHMDTKYQVAPKGYYAKMMLSRSGSNVFSSNANFGTYLGNHGTTVEME